MNNFFDISDLNKEQIYEIFNIENSNKFLEGKTIGLIFEKPSTRTRISYSVAINQLGGRVIDLNYENLNISRYESFEDTFKAMNCYLDGLIFRTEKHQKLIDASNFFKKNIINALSDKSHPCQILSDIYTLKERFNTLKINIIWMGDINNVCYSLYEAAKIIDDINLQICSDETLFKNLDWDKNKNIKFFNDISKINYKNAHCVMTDVFISMNDEINSRKSENLIKYQINSDIMNKTNDHCVFMHCLPAKVGSEVTDEVINSEKSIVWDQAKNRLLVQKKLLQYLKW